MPAKTATKTETRQVKRFGGGANLSKLREFELVAYRDEEEVTLNFTIRLHNTSSDMIQLVALQASDAEGDAYLEPMMRILRKMMVNNDGVPVAWNLKEATLKPKNADELPTAFRGPDGKIYELTEQDKIDFFQDIENGSSRRRWKYVMEEDEDLVIEMQDLMDAAKWAIEEAAERPTQPRKS